MSYFRRAYVAYFILNVGSTTLTTDSSYFISAAIIIGRSVHKLVILILGTANSTVDVDTQVISTYPQDPTIDSTTQISEVLATSLAPIQEDVDSIDTKGEVIVDFSVAPETIEKFKTNKIVLGTKPTKSVVNQEPLPPIQAKVLLHNIYTYLQNSGRYCSQCLTLFPDEIAFDSHTYLVHITACNGIKGRHINDSYPCYICGKEFNYSDLQCHLRHVHQININTQVKLKATWNSHTEKALSQNKSSICINLKHKQMKTLKSANVSKASKEREKVKKWLTNKKSIRDVKQQIDGTTKTCRKTSNVSRYSTETENLSRLDGTHVQDIKTESSGNHCCFHCDMLFVTQNDLIEHLYSTMQLKNINREVCDKKIPNHKSPKIDINTLNTRVNVCATKNINHIKNSNAKQSIKSETKKINDLNNLNPPNELNTSMYFKCDVCSFHFNSTELCSRHLIMQHGIINKEFKKEPFVPNCVFCWEKMANVDEYNFHIIDIHQIKYTEKLFDAKQISESEQAVNSESEIGSSSSFALKSTLFKCMQCDVHFVSAKAAQSHAEHMELLINWKCNNCYRIFKKNDEFLHESQHTFSNKFIVHDLSTSTFSQVLYSCSKCAIHFTEEEFLTHYKICGTETPIASYCKICDILIDEGTIKSHAMMHSQKEPVNFITIDADISIKPEGSCVQKRKSIDKAETSTKKKKHMDNLFNLYYCETCNSFLNKQDYYIHIRAQCVKLKKSICNICGLVLTNRNYSVHKDLHSKFGFLKVQDFTFCEVKTKKQICPPMPEYLKCNVCKVIFISQFLLSSHECHDENYLTCHICENKLSDDAFKLHMSFHNYSIANILKDGRQENDLFIEEKSLINSPCLKEQTSCTLDRPRLSDVLQSKSDLRPSIVKSLQVSSPASFKSGSKIFNETYSNLSKSTNINCKTDVCVPKLHNSSVAKSVQSSCSTTTKIKCKKSNVELVPIIYTCENCNITVDTYDKVIEHCQSHYEGKEMNNNTEDPYCHECDLKFDKSCHESHEKFHQDKSFFKLLNFDTYYFSFDNNIWIKHVFGSMPQSLIDPIVHKSIYRSECRVKMQLVQDGPPHLTVFQCNQCQCFIDQPAIYKHAENSCFKLRNHPCNFCGLPFISSNTQIAHEKIHETPNITVESYRIVTFNKNEDRKLNNFLYNQTLYTLYQCRNCDGATDKSQIMNHKCDVCNLKKCLECGLLLCGAEFENHILRHKKLSSFIPNNMKVIMFGGITKGNANKIKSSFRGIIYDYLYYRCSKCQVCMKKKYFPAHVCSLRLSRSQCWQCDLHFLNTQFKSHRKLHDDPDFEPDNVRVVTFDPSSPDELILKVARIYKCTCGLNFLDAISISTHIKSCNPKIRTSKQKCSKCDLLFTPNILFSHLLTHHGNKKHKYTFEIIDMTCETNLTNILYRCPQCKLHFVQGLEASAHLLDCKGINSEGKQCHYCNLLFNEVCFNIHINHCQIGESNNNIYEIKNCSIPLVKIDDMNMNRY